MLLPIHNEAEEPIRNEVRRRITNAYYDSRNEGETMETAADRAANAVMELVRVFIAERDSIAEDEQAAVGALLRAEDDPCLHCGSAAHIKQYALSRLVQPEAESESRYDR